MCTSWNDAIEVQLSHKNYKPTGKCALAGTDFVENLKDQGL